MMRSRNQLILGVLFVLLGVCPAVTTMAQLGGSDLSTELTGPASVSFGDTPLITVNYANAGPTNARSAYINAFVPFGLPAPWSEITQDDFDALQASAATFDAGGNLLTTTDTLGNTPYLFIEDAYCEHFLFQLQRTDDDTDANPIEGLNSGVSASFTFNPQIPMDPPKIGKVKIVEPASLAQTYRPASAGQNFLNAAGTHRYSRGGGCDDDPEGGCTDLSYCMGPRISAVDLIDGELELVNDGSSAPTLGCDEFVDFTPGKIALMERGTCNFDQKIFNAQLAGAVAVFMVNDGRCGDFPASDECVLNMGAVNLGGLIAIPFMQVSITDGQPVLDAVSGGQTVRVLMGPQGESFYIDSSAFLSVVSDEDPNVDNDESLLVSQVAASVDPPVAAFTYSPAAPVVGSPVTFTDASTGGAPTSWMWNFGDGATSTDQNPSHTYTGAGTFDVMLTVSNNAGSDAATQSVTVNLPQTLDNAYFIPAAALAAGAEGSFFQTDVDINSNSSADASYAFLWLPRGTDNSTPTQSETYTIAAGASVRYENVLAEVFGFDPDVAGALAVLSNSANLNIMSRTYNVPTAKIAGTFGQALPGIPAADLIMQGETRRIIFMSENDDLRANLGCVNGVDDSVRIAVTLYDDAGTMLETRNMDLQPWSNFQFNRLFQSYAPTNGYVDVTASKPGAAYYCYGSVLDNGSNDPTSILPTEYGANASFVTYFVPAAALAAGAEGSFFQTDVDINNAGDEMTSYQFLWLPRGSDNSAPTTSDFYTLAAGASVRYENVLAEVFGFEPDVAGALAISADSSQLGIMSRTYNVPTTKIAGTFGQAIPGIPGDNLIMQGETKRIIFMSENDDLRANVGCVNGVNDSVRIAVTLYDDAGAMLETRNMDLQPWSNFQFNRLFQSYSPTNGYVDVSASKPGAAYYCYGSVLDNGSNDPTTILPQ